MKKIQNGFIKRNTLIALLVIGIVVAGAVTLLPKGFSGDLSLIGKGTVSVVLTHEKNLLASQATMELLNGIRSDYEPNVHFIAVDAATKDGQGFMQQQQVGVVTLSFFGPDGKAENLLQAGATESAVRATLDDMLSR